MRYKFTSITEQYVLLQNAYHMCYSHQFHFSCFFVFSLIMKLPLKDPVNKPSFQYVMHEFTVGGFIRMERILYESI